MADSTDEYPDSLHELLGTLWMLREYLPRVTLIGGWVPELYKRYGGIKEWRSRLSQTTEADILVPLRVAREGRSSIPEVLREAGFRPPRDETIAAVWLNDNTKGAKIEFLTGLTTPAKQQATPIPVAGQPGLGAFALPEDLNLLERNSRVLNVSWSERGQRRSVLVRVPQLAAYVVNKTLTSRRRPSVRTGDEKRAKDLVYLRDLMCAGPEVVDEIADGMVSLIASDPPARRLLKSASVILRSLTAGEIEFSAEILSERDRLPSEAARADLRGYLQDLCESIDEALEGSA